MLYLDKRQIYSNCDDDQPIVAQVRSLCVCSSVAMAAAVLRSCHNPVESFQQLLAEGRLIDVRIRCCFCHKFLPLWCRSNFVRRSKLKYATIDPQVL